MGVKKGATVIFTKTLVKTDFSNSLLVEFRNELQGKLELNLSS